MPTNQITGIVSTENAIDGFVIVYQQITGYVSEEVLQMSTDDNHIRMFIRDDLTLKATLNHKDEDGTITDPVDLTGAKIWMTAKQTTRDADAGAIFMKRNTAAGGSDAEILVALPLTGQIEIYLVPADTENADAATYQYDIQVILATGKTYTTTRDKITFAEDVTRATS